MRRSPVAQRSQLPAGNPDDWKTVLPHIFQRLIESRQLSLQKIQIGLGKMPAEQSLDLLAIALGLICVLGGGGNCSLDQVLAGALPRA